MQQHVGGPLPTSCNGLRSQRLYRYILFIVKLWMHGMVPFPMRNRPPFLDVRKHDLVIISSLFLHKQCIDSLDRSHTAAFGSGEQKQTNGHLAKSFIKVFQTPIGGPFKQLFYTLPIW